MTDYKIPYRYQCRPYQIEAWKALEGGCKRAALCWHRGAGKDLFALNYLISQMVEKPGVYLHCFPRYIQGKRAIWNSIHETHNGDSMGYLEHFPPELVVHKNSQEMSIRLWNGSIYCVMGLDGKNATQARGMNPRFLILSEYAYMDPEAWYTLEPRISQNDGVAVFASTPNGQNHFYSLCEYARSKPGEWYHSHVGMNDSKVLTEEHMNNLRVEGVPEDFIQQEYYCSFTRGAEGSYYGKHIQACKDEGRIGVVNISPDIPCCTGWDIGVGDSTAIWVFQVLNNGMTQFLHYYENQGMGLEHYIKHLEKWRVLNDAIWSKHFVPHDMQQREFTAGISRVQLARNMGITMTILPLKRVEEGIQACRSMLPSCTFHQTHCKLGVRTLEFYHKKWNEALKTYSDEPLHDKWSHGADAFRTACMGVKMYGGGSGTSLSKTSIEEMRRRNLGY